MALCCHNNREGKHCFLVSRELAMRAPIRVPVNIEKAWSEMTVTGQAASSMAHNSYKKLMHLFVGNGMPYKSSSEKRMILR